MEDATKAIGNYLTDLVRSTGREIEWNAELHVAISRGSDGGVFITSQGHDDGMILSAEQFDWIKTALDK